MEEQEGQRQDLFSCTDKLLADPHGDKFTLILGDTGMGKTLFLLNYLARYLLGKQRRQAEIHYLSLDDPDVLTKIEKKTASVQARHVKAVLLLDGLDEDAGASGHPGERLLEITQASKDFFRVLITSRTQLFERDQAIPPESRVLVSPLDNPAARHDAYKIGKLYVSPFNLRQIDTYLRRKFKRPTNVNRARTAVKKIQDLSARPLLLSNIEAVFSQKVEIHRSSRVYELLINKWIEWDKKRVTDPTLLREFIECLAVELYKRWKNGLGARIQDSESELSAVGASYKVARPNMKDISVRSLLNRDSEHQLKFAHRSIMEYLFIVRFHKEATSTLRVARQTGSESLEWSGQMKQFYVEHLFDIWAQNKQPLRGYELADLSGLEDLQIAPFRTVRSEPIIFERWDIPRLVPHESPHLYREIYVPSDRALVAEHDIVSAAWKVAKHQHLSTTAKPNIAPLMEEIRRNLSSQAVLVIDHGLGLVWESPGSELHVSHELAQARAAALSRAKFAGYSTWRLPTTEEVSSLACLLGEDHPQAFDKLQTRIWTADKLGVEGLCVEFDKQEIRRYHGYVGDLQAPRTICVASLTPRAAYGRAGARMAA